MMDKDYKIGKSGTSQDRRECRHARKLNEVGRDVSNACRCSGNGATDVPR